MEMLTRSFNTVLNHDFNKLGRNRLKAGQYVISRRVKRSRNKKGRVAL